MEWQLALLIILGSFVILLASGLPVAFCFWLVNIVGIILFWGGLAGLEQFIVSMYSSLASFVLLPVPLFILMGEVIFHSGIGPVLIDTLDRFIGRIPGRLSLLAVASGTMMATLTGTNLASAGLLGEVLVPQMEQRGYKKSMTLGPIIGSSCLAMMIPPSALAVLLCAIAEISVGRVLIAIIVPGLLMAVLYATYIITRCTLQPSIAPLYEVTPTSPLENTIALLRNVIPLGFIIFFVVGIIFLGIATSSEAAATGCLATFILCAFHRKLNWQVVRKSVRSTLLITVMMFTIIAGSRAFSQILAYTGVSANLISVLTDLELAPIFILVMMQVVLLIMGCFVDAVSIMMISIPIFFPIIENLGYNPIWFAVLMLINIDMGGITPPFGLLLYVMKGVAPSDTTMMDIIKASIPFLLLDTLALVLIVVFPVIALWLPNIMR